MFYRDCFSSPIGDIALLAYQDNLIEISLLGYRGLSREGKNSKSRFVNETRELTEYFFEGRKKFNITYSLETTPFALSVYQSMLNIKYGKTKSYSEIASDIYNPKACRAVGTACGNNPLPIIIPCHRVLAKNGIGGFSSGLSRKKFLLELETN
jgi:methylated-DNA-[protein]-cysteine S-methyltransferase